MNTAGASISLQDEFEGVIQAIHSGKKLTCFGKSSKGEQCGNRLSISTRATLAKLFENIVELLKDAGSGVETLLEEASSLVMCVRFHQGEAAAKFEEWTKRIPARNFKLPYSGGNVENPSVAPTVEPSKGVTPTGSRSKERKVDAQQLDQHSGSKSVKSSFDPDFDDSGLESDSEENLFGNRAVASSMTRTAAPSLAEYAGPQTPQKATKTVSTDSGISMSYDKSLEAQSIKYANGPESPLIRKAPRAKRAPAANPSRPAVTPIQPPSLPIRRRKFVPFDDPFLKMRNYINKPLLGKNDMKEGYIYGFQIEGCAYTKIGLAAKRESEPSLEAALEARIREHKRDGWPDPKVVLKIEVPHVHRVEKLIHYHLGTGRMKEQCDRGSHTEWFNNSLDEIYTVAIAWNHWILSAPYEELHGGRHHLSEEWKGYLGTVPKQSGKDVWLQWLCRYVHGLPRLISTATLETSKWIEEESTEEARGSFVRNSASGIKVEVKRVKTCLI